MLSNFSWVMTKEYKKINVCKFSENFNGKNVGFFYLLAIKIQNFDNIFVIFQSYMF